MNDAMFEGVGEALRAPRPQPPARDNFESARSFEQAWTTWVHDGLERAESVLSLIRALVDGDQRGAPGAWVPLDLVAITMLRAAVARERNLDPASRVFSDGELERVGVLLSRFDPEVIVPSGGIGGEGFWGRAATAHLHLPAGVHEAIEPATRARYRLIVGGVADLVGGEASAALPVAEVGQHALDDIAALLRGGASSHREMLERVAETVRATGRDVPAEPAILPAEGGGRLAEVLQFRARRLRAMPVPRGEPSSVPERDPPSG